MKRNLLSAGFLLLILFITCTINFSHAQDLPGAPANLQTAPAGTIVIAMDNTNQACSVASSGTYLFNLKSYGLVISLLDISYKLKWVIKTGKAKDGIDFSANAERISPAYIAPQSLDFRAGPLLIFPADTAGIDHAIKYINAGFPDSCKVKVYRLTTAVTVDVRYNLTRPPKAALLNDSCDIHRNFMEMASVPFINYKCLPDASALRTGCYTIATDPHTMISDLSSFDADSIYNFVMAGGNFLAECEGVNTFETLKKYQSVTGTLPNLTGGGYANFNNNVYYDNADMAYGQYQGTFRPWTRGAIKVWRFDSANTNNFYSVTSCKRNASDNLYYAATVSKLTSDIGSVVFYLGNHEYFTHDCHTCVAGNTISQDEVNGIRMYLNAVLVPSKFLSCVNVWDIPLSVTIGDFNATKSSEQSSLLKWSSLTEKQNAIFFVEHSSNGKDFSVIGQVAGKGDTENGFNYEFAHNDVQRGLNYYRLKTTSAPGNLTYSDTRIVVFGNKNRTLSVYPNPATSSTSIILDAKDGERVYVSFIDMAGNEVKTGIVTIAGQKADLNVNDLGKGLYSIVVKKQTGEQLRGKLLIAY